MGFTSDFNRPAMGNSIDDDFDWMRDNWHYILSVAANGSIVLPGWQTTVQGSDKSEPTSITLTRGTKKIIIYYTWTSNSVSSIQFCYDNGVGDTSPSVTCYPAIPFYYDDSGNPYGTIDKNIPASLKTGLVSWWSLEEDGTSTRVDSHGTNNLSPYAPALSPVHSLPSETGKVGNAVNFSGSSEWLRKQSSNCISGNNDWSWAGWFKLDSYPGGTTFDCFFGVTEGSPATNNHISYYFVYDDNINKFRLGAYAGTTYIGINAPTYGAATLGEWVFAYIYHDVSEDTFGIRINNGTTDTGTYSSSLTPNTWDHIYLGAMSSSYPYYIDGSIDELGHWNRLLTETELTALYQYGDGIAYTDIP